MPDPKQANPCTALTAAVVATLSPTLAKLKPGPGSGGISCAYGTSDEDNIQLNYQAGPLSQTMVSLPECVSINKETANSQVQRGDGSKEFTIPALGASSLGIVEPFTDGLAEQNVGWTQGDDCFFMSVELEAPISTSVFQQAAISVAKSLG